MAKPWDWDSKHELRKQAIPVHEDNKSQTTQEPRIIEFLRKSGLHQTKESN